MHVDKFWPILNSVLKWITIITCLTGWWQLVNMQWHTGKSFVPTDRSMRPCRMLLYVTSVYLSTYAFSFITWIPSNSRSHWEISVFLCFFFACVCVSTFAYSICGWWSICIEIRQDVRKCLPLPFAFHVVCCGSMELWDLLFQLPRENVERPLNASWDLIGKSPDWWASIWNMNAIINEPN